MSKKWEINRVSTSGRIFDKIKTEMVQPVGIVLFGADCDFKNEVVKELTEALGLQTSSDSWESDYEHGQCYQKTEAHLKYRFGEGQKYAMVILNSDNSAEHEVRHGFVCAIKNAGAASVVGIYVKATEVSLPEGKKDISMIPKVQLNQHIAAIEQSNPTADGLDYLIVVSEE